MRNLVPLFRTFLAVVALAAVAVSPAFAAPVLVDDFSSPDAADAFVISLLNANPYSKLFSGPGIIGGNRELNVEVSGAPGPVSAVGTIGLGSFLFNTATPGSFALLKYDGTDPVGLNGADLVDGTNNTFRLDFDFLDAGGAATTQVEIALASKVGSANFVGQIVPSATGFSFFAPFASFVPSGPFSFSSVDNIAVILNGPAHENVDFRLTRILTTVPEPSTLALVGLGGVVLAGSALRRRKS